MFPNTKIDWASDLFRGDIIHPKGLSPCVPFHASLRFLASSPSIEDRTGRADGGEGESWPVLCVRNVAPRSPSPPVNTTLLSRNHSLRETKSQFIWKTRLTHLSSALITERRVGWCLAEGPPADSRPVARGAGRGGPAGVLCLCRPFLIGAPAGHALCAQRCPEIPGRYAARPSRCGP